MKILLLAFTLLAFGSSFVQTYALDIVRDGKPFLTIVSAVPPELQAPPVKGKRQHVHLSKDVETATKVGMRHGKPIIFAIKTLPMQADGVLFYLADNGVWLVDEVAAKYLESPL